MVLKDREYKKRKAMDALFYISFMIIPVIAFALFYVYVNLDSFIMAFQKPVDGKLVFAKFDNFKWVFEKLKNGAVNDEDFQDFRGTDDNVPDRAFRILFYL